MTYTPTLDHESNGKLVAAAEQSSAAKRYEDCLLLWQTIDDDYTVTDKSLTNELKKFKTKIDRAFDAWRTGFAGLPSSDEYASMVAKFNKALEEGGATWNQAPAAQAPQPQPAPAQTGPVTLEQVLDAIQGPNGVTAQLNVHDEQIAATGMVVDRTRGDVTALTSRVDKVERELGITQRSRRTVSPPRRKAGFFRSLIAAEVHSH